MFKLGVTSPSRWHVKKILLGIDTKYWLKFSYFQIYNKKINMIFERKIKNHLNIRNLVPKTWF